MLQIPLKESFYLFNIFPQPDKSMTEFKVEFSDANNAVQYDTSAADLSSLYGGEPGNRLFIGDRDSLSMVQIRHRQLSRVVNCHPDNHGLSKEEGVKYLNIDPGVPEAGNKALTDALAFINEAHEQGKDVLISCENGRSKSACVALYFLTKGKGLSVEDAFNGVTALRGGKLRLRPELAIMLDQPRLLERDAASLNVCWNDNKELKGVSYELQMAEKVGEASREQVGAWKTLSSTLKAVNVRKKNLKATSLYRFRYRYCKEDFCSEWSLNSESLCPLSPTARQMDAPSVAAQDSTSVTLKWKEMKRAEGYILRYRKNSEEGWTMTKMLSGQEVRKKNLEPGNVYYFSVTAVMPDNGTCDWSNSCSPVTLAEASLELSPFMKQLMPSTLLVKGGKTSTKDALAGKITAVYFSASWCGPCRTFTPKLAEVYAEAKRKGLPFEVVFCSADQSLEEFNAYYGSHHPWLAVDFEAPETQALAGKFSVRGIPQLSILDTTGRFIEPNAVQTGGVSIARVEQWCAKK